MEIGDRIRLLREQRELTLEQVGEYVGVNKATVQRYESGEIDIKRTTAIKLAEILGTNPAYIMGWTDNPARDLLPASEDTGSKVNERAKRLQEATAGFSDVAMDKLIEQAHMLQLWQAQ